LEEEELTASEDQGREQARVQPAGHWKARDLINMMVMRAFRVPGMILSTLHTKIHLSHHNLLR